jgi:hypothetical protein
MFVLNREIKSAARVRNVVFPTAYLTSDAQRHVALTNAFRCDASTSRRDARLCCCSARRWTMWGRPYGTDLALTPAFRLQINTSFLYHWNEIRQLLTPKPTVFRSIYLLWILILFVSTSRACKLKERLFEFILMALVLVYKPATLNAAFMLQHISWVWTLWLADCWRSTSAFDVARVIIFGTSSSSSPALQSWVKVDIGFPYNSSPFKSISGHQPPVYYP